MYSQIFKSHLLEKCFYIINTVSLIYILVTCICHYLYNPIAVHSVNRKANFDLKNLLFLDICLVYWFLSIWFYILTNISKNSGNKSLKNTLTKRNNSNFILNCSILLKKKEHLMLWGHILPYPKDGLVQPKHIRRAELARGRQLLVSYETFDKQRTASTFFVWLPFSANTITFTYHPLFELFFHRSYLKTTTFSWIRKIQMRRICQWKVRVIRNARVQAVLFVDFTRRSLSNKFNVVMSKNFDRNQLKLNWWV